MADLWEFGDAEDLKPLEDSSDEEDSKAEFDELSCLPPDKRRKLQKLRDASKQVELIDLDNEENDGDKPAKQDRKAAKHKAPDSDSDLDLEFIPIIKRAREAAPLDPIILHNQALLRRFKEAAQEPALDDLTADLEEPERPQPSLTHAQPAANRSQNGASGSDSDDGSDAEEEAEEETRVVLKLQCSRGTLQLRTKTQSQMRSLFDAFKGQAKNKGWIQDTQMANMKFVFEGDPLTGNETAESLDLEGGEIVEVQW